MPIERYQDEIAAVGCFVELCLSGLQYGMEATSSVGLLSKVAEVLKRPEPFPTDSAREEALRHAATLESFACAQRAQGYPYVYGLGAIKLWSLLEGLVDEVVAERLRQGSLFLNPALTRIKGPLVSFMYATEEERLEILLERLKDATEAHLKKGCGRFEALLDAVQLGGAVDGAARKALLELSEVRNVLMHRNAAADRRFRDSCPWFGAAVGEPLALSWNHYKLYELAAVWYLLELHGRLTRAAGDEVNEEQAILHRAFAGQIAAFLDSRAAERAGGDSGPSGAS